MNRFALFPCVIQKDETSSYTGPLASLVSEMNSNLVLFFPISEENASLINFTLNDENRKKITVNQDVVGIYKTMIKSWKSGDKHISGVILDAKYDPESKEDIIDASVIIIDSNGNLDTLVKTNFVHAMVVVAIEDMEIYVTDDLFSKLKPKDDEEIEEGEDDEEDEDDGGGNDKGPEPIDPPSPKQSQKVFPVDKNIISIAKQIMEGKVKDK